MEVRKKQDGAMPRTPEDLERKYEFEKRFRELKEAERNAKNAASKEYVDQGLNGKVSKGYGLGEIPHTSVDVNAELTTGYFRTLSTTENTSFTHGAAHVRVYDKNEVVQNLIRVPNGIEQVRRTTDGGATWTVQYVNPPLNAGTEYPTIERYNGETKYAKLINFGTLPNNATKTIAHGITGLLTDAIPVSMEAFASNGTVFQQFPIVNSSGKTTAKIHLTATNISIYTFDDMTAYTDAKVLIEYIKI